MAHQARGGAPCYWQQRVNGRAYGRVGCCATTGEGSGASESPSAKILVMMFPDASDKVWASYVAQIPTVELTGSVAIADMCHEPLGFLSGPFWGLQERWATVDKEGFAIVSTVKWLPYPLWCEVAIHFDRRNLAYIFDANGAPRFKAVAQRLHGRSVSLGQFPYTIVHIPGDENC